MSVRSPQRLKVNALAKINLTLRVLGSRDDGYHELRTTFQSIAIHDSLTVTATRGPFALECDEASCPIDESNLVWQAAARLWRAAGRRGSPRGVRVRLEKRIPLEAGLGGGSSDAAAALRGLAALWRISVGRAGLHELAAGLGADVPFFLEGGTALGVERGDVLFRLADFSRAWVVLVVPAFGVSTKDAYAWWDAASARPDSRVLRMRARRAGPVRTAKRAVSNGGSRSSILPQGEWRNDLQEPVAQRHPQIARLVRRLETLGATRAAMSGSGSAVFGLFDNAWAAESAAAEVKSAALRTLVTRTVSSSEFAVLSRLQRLAAR
jgi:4-diphosphocytidyl-2-C-methyl-D-erythritol kinase